MPVTSLFYQDIERHERKEPPREIDISRQLKQPAVPPVLVVEESEPISESAAGFILDLEEPSKKRKRKVDA